MILLIVILLLLIFCSAFFSASETALFSLSTHKARAFGKGSSPREQMVSRLLDQPGDLLVSLLILNVLVNILVQNVMSSIFGDFRSWWINVGAPLVVVLIFGEVIPKSLGIANNERLARFSAPYILLLQKVLLPLRLFLTKVTAVVAKLLFFFLRKENEISPEELRHALQTSKESGVLNEDEAKLIRGYLNFQEGSAKELMRPRDEILYINSDETLSRLIHLFVDQECSRIPVCQEGLDTIIGIMTSRSFFLHRDKIEKTADLFPYLSKPLFSPESMPAKALLRQMYDAQDSMAIVVDEYGSVSGLITIEDLLETVVGPIADRRDERSRFTRSGEDTIIASGKMELTELEEIFGIPFTSENNLVTIGGWLTEKLGDIPKSGTKYMTEDLLFHVLSSDAKRVRRVYIRKIKKK